MENLGCGKPLNSSQPNTGAGRTANVSARKISGKVCLLQRRHREHEVPVADAEESDNDKEITAEVVMGVTREVTDEEFVLRDTAHQRNH